MDHVVYRDADNRDCPAHVVTLWGPAEDGFVVSLTTVLMSQGDVAQTVRKVHFHDPVAPEQPKTGTWRWLP